MILLDLNIIWLRALIALRHKLEISFWDCFRFCLCNECIAVISYLAQKLQNCLRLQLNHFFYSFLLFRFWDFPHFTNRDFLLLRIEEGASGGAHFYPYLRRRRREGASGGGPLSKYLPVFQCTREECCLVWPGGVSNTWESHCRSWGIERERRNLSLSYPRVLPLLIKIDLNFQLYLHTK